MAPFVRLQRRSRCVQCGMREWTRTVQARLSFIDRHRHDATPWAPEPPAAPSAPPHGLPSWAIVAGTAVVLLILVVVA